MATKLSHLRKEEGFTLIELMIVMVVLGILAGIVLFGVGTFSQDAKEAADTANDRQCATAVAAYQASHGGANPTTQAQLAGYFSGTAPTCTLP